MKRSDFVHHLDLHRCTLVREGGNHPWCVNRSKNRRSSVPPHDEISDILARKICRDLDIQETPRPQPSGRKTRLFEICIDDDSPQELKDYVKRMRGSDYKPTPEDQVIFEKYAVEKTPDSGLPHP